MNPRIKAWVYVPGTKINYAILQSKDNKFYLHHDEHNKSSISGQIFMDYRNHANFSSKNTFIYGHNMYDKRVFPIYQNTSVVVFLMLINMSISIRRLRSLSEPSLRFNLTAVHQKHIR